MNRVEIQQSRRAGPTSMAWVYCSSRSSILEMGRAGWDLFTLLLEGGRRVTPAVTSVGLQPYPEP